MEISKRARVIVVGVDTVRGMMVFEELKQRDCELYVLDMIGDVGRQPSPAYENAVSLEQFKANEMEFDLVVYAGISSNVKQTTEKEHFERNLEVPSLLADIIENAMGTRFVYLASKDVVLSRKTQAAYTRAQIEGFHAVIDRLADRAQVIIVGNTHGTLWQGKLSLLNMLPRSIACAIFSPISAIKPTTDVTILGDAILAGFGPQKRIVTDNKLENRFYLLASRAIDLAFAISIIALLFWFLSAVAIWVRLDSSGGAIFAQQRIGKAQREFRCLKFRTMEKNTEQVGTHEVSSAKITKAGAILRRTKVDELPQVWNILRNEISLIGPRPCLPNQQELIKARELAGVFLSKPGISGWAQVHDIDIDRKSVV